MPGSRLRPACRAATAVLLLASAARATGFDDYALEVVEGCASVSGGSLVMQSCTAPSCSGTSRVFMATPLPGTIRFDVHYETQATFDVPMEFWVASTGQAELYTLFPECPACTGDVTGVSVHVEAAGQVTFGLAQADWLSCKPTTCTLSNLQFVPDAGVSTLAGGSDGALVLDHQALDSVLPSLATLGDVDGDGFDDLAYGTPYQPFGFPGGSVVVVSGKTGGMLHTLEGTSAYHLGSLVNDAGDVDGDAISDIVASEDYGVRVFSGATGQLLFQPYPAGASTVSPTVDGAGDADGDGFADVVVGDSSDSSSKGRVLLYSGATHAVLHEVTGDSVGDFLGSTVAGVGDVDLDGYPDFAAGASSAGYVRVYSGLTGAVLLTLPGAVPVPNFGIALDAAGDFDGDGQPDVVVGAANSTTLSTGQVQVHSGATGGVLFSLQGTKAKQSLGSGVARAGDLDHDGFDDVLVRETVVEQGNPPWTYRLRVFAGPSGAPLQDVLVDGYLVFAHAMDGGRDLDGDGTPDIVATGEDALGHTHVLGISGTPALQGVPKLSATGTLLPGAPLAVSLAGGPPSGAALLVAGLDVALLSLKGGILVPTPDLVVSGLALQPDGSLQLVASWPTGLTAPLAVLLQAWMPAPLAKQGFVASNGLMLAPP